MKVPVSWLKEFVDTGLSAEKLAERLALTGTEVERISHAGLPAEGGNLDRFVIGQVKSRAPHPDADRLSLCEVDLGGGRSEQIVCGAKNFQAGDKAAVCLPGGMLPGRPEPLRAAKIRGVESHGMMCSEAELGLSGESAGIMILPEDAPVGARLVDHLPLSDDVLELEITPNRPDCLSMYGVAREVAAVTGAPLAPEPVAPAAPRGDDTIGELVSVSVADERLCPRYGARLIAGVSVAESPAWLKARITAAGMRPVNNVVDITNYVMWTLGQPMHAFDLARIAGRQLAVRRAARGEKIITIDGSERRLTPDMLVIADAEGPVAIAGIMGGEASEVSAATTDILLEAANFNGRSVMETSMALGLRSESSTRFEKGLDQELAPKALAMAARLMVEITGGRLVPGEVDIQARPFMPAAVRLRPGRVEALLGIRVPDEEIKSILTRLGFGVREKEGELLVTIPSYRADVEREVDVIEEIARVFGLGLIPPTLPSDMRVLGGLSPEQQARRSVARALVERGLTEVISYSFIAPDFGDRLRLDADDGRREVVALANPLSVEQSVMRTMMLPSLLTTLAANLSLQNQDVNIFELGRIYRPAAGEDLCDERRVIAGCLSGSLQGHSWMTGGGTAGFFTGKGMVEAIFASIAGDFTVERASEPFLHPGKSAAIVAGGRQAGYVGEVHPLVLEAFDIDKPVVAFEILEQELLASGAGIIVFEDLITYPASYQDLAVVVEVDRPADEIIGVISDAGAPLLKSVRVFDIFTGEQIGAGKKSVALSLEFRSPERTLTDEDVAAARASIVTALAEKLGASLRA
ncbi:MAG: phenylalanine--tRNA ligase subunit beta [Thermoleophilia bacterium]